MAIALQGYWTVRIKSKSAAYAQRFVIAGGTSADGTYPGTPGSPGIFVGGNQWSINIQNQPPGGAWVDSAQRITFPTVVGGLLSFDIRSNDAGADKDYDDLILTCSVPASSSDFVVYGRARTYEGLCIFNPCYPWYSVIDSPVALTRALAVPELAAVIAKLYPQLTPSLQPRPKPGPGPDPAPDFVPLVLPTGASAPVGGVEFRSRTEGLGLEALTAIPATAPRKRSIGPSADEREKLAVEALATTSARVRANASPLAFADAIDRADLRTIAGVVDGLGGRFVCTTSAAPGLLLRFLEYDHTASERAGAAYTGTGDRETLGLAVTDEAGNYLFRFSRSLADFATESVDVAVGELAADAIRPDVIVQVLGNGGLVEYESAPYFDIPNLRRIDLCFPRGVVHPTTDCSGDRRIQSVGDILVLHSALSGHPNTLDAEGRITARNANAPAVDCAGWRGALRVYGCLGKAVACYTIRYRRAAIDTDWQYVDEPHKLNYIPDFAVGYTGTSVGSTLRGVRIDGGPVQTRPTYDNHDGDSNWIENDLKIILSSGLYRPADSPGTVEFRFQGYDASGNIVAGADDTLPLYIHNQTSMAGRPQGSKGDISSITVGGASLGDCGLFELSSQNEPITVTYRAVDPFGFLEAWALSVTRGNNIELDVVVSGGVTPRAHDPATPCVFHGTHDEPSATAADYVSTALTPGPLAPANGAWLPAGMTFCAFAFTLTATDRVTDGRKGGTYPQVVFWQDLIGLSYSA